MTTDAVRNYATPTNADTGPIECIYRGPLRDDLALLLGFGMRCGKWVAFIAQGDAEFAVPPGLIDFP